MCVVDNDQRLTNAADAFHAPRRRDQRPKAVRDLRRYKARIMKHGGHREEVRDVVATEQRRDDLRTAIRQDEVEALPRGGCRQVLGTHVALSDAVGNDAPGRSPGNHAGAGLIVKIDHCAAQARPREEPLLGRRVGFHASVVIEVVTREVGEDGDIDTRAVQAPLLDADRTRLEGTGRCTLIGEAGEQTHQGGRLGGREPGLDETAGEAGAQRADHRTARRQGLGEELGHRRLAVGSGHRDQRQALARRAADGMGQRAGQRAQAGRLEVRHGPRRIPGEIAPRLPEHCCRAARDGVGDVATAVSQVAWIGQKQVARTYLAAVVGHAGRSYAKAGELFEEVGDPAHSGPLRPASAT